MSNVTPLQSQVCREIANDTFATTLIKYLIKVTRVGASELGTYLSALLLKEDLDI